MPLPQDISPLNPELMDTIVRAPEMDWVPQDDTGTTRGSDAVLRRERLHGLPGLGGAGAAGAGIRPKQGRVGAGTHYSTSLMNSVFGWGGAMISMICMSSECSSRSWTMPAGMFTQPPSVTMTSPVPSK